MFILYCKIVCARISVFIFKKASFLPRKIKVRYAKFLSVCIRNITKEVIERQII